MPKKEEQDIQPYEVIEGKNKFGTVQFRAISEELSKSYLDYAMSVIVARALPDVRDGLKPVQRRILYAMREMGLSAGAKHQKSAKIVGEVMGKYHPHGDMAIYDTMVRMAQWWSLRSPLVDGQGNFGSIDGDPAAAPRYSEARLNPIAETILDDIDKETVDFVDNYDSTMEEPKVLPARVPNLLLNGAQGIAVGMATNIPPHNLREIVDALLLTQTKPEVQVDELINIIKGPDFPTGGIIYNQAEIMEAFATGRGRVLIRGRAEIEDNKNRSRIVISELPYQTNKATFITHIADLVKNKKIEGISDIRDESDREHGVRVIVDLKLNAAANKILNQLYDMTELQTVFHYNMVALVNGIQPRLLTLVEVLNYFLEHRRIVVKRRVEYELKIAKARAHILEGLKIALDNLDAVIALIRKSKDRSEAKSGLVSQFGLSEIQSDAILDMRLSQLANLERQRVYDEYEAIMKIIADLEDILAKPERIEKIITDELNDVKEKYGEDRRTEVHPEALGQFTTLDLIQEEKVLITLTKSNYIKRIPADTYKSQLRGGKGVIGMATVEDDSLLHVRYASTHDDMLFFTNLGRVFRLQSFDIPASSRQSKGVALPNLIQISPEEKVTEIINVDRTQNISTFFFFTTIKGIVKRIAAEQLKSVRKNGMNVLGLKPDDQLLTVKLTSGNDEIGHITKNGQIIIYNENEVRAMGRAAAGVRGINLKPTDEVVSTAVMPTDAKEIMIVSVKGMGKRVDISEFRHQHRGGSGIRVAKINDKTGPVVMGITLTENDVDAIIVSTQGQVIRITIKSIKKQSRQASGVILMRPKDNDTVSTLAVMEKEEDAK